MATSDLIRLTYRPEMALRHVAVISQFHRIQGSPGFRAAAAYVAGQLAAAGLQVWTNQYPAKWRWKRKGRPASWSCACSSSWRKPGQLTW